MRAGSPVSSGVKVHAVVEERRVAEQHNIGRGTIEKLGEKQKEALRSQLCEIMTMVPRVENGQQQQYSSR